MAPAPILVAHRAGNAPASARLALAKADVIEVDAHVFRGRVEVRHEKILWPTSRLWERWFLLPAGTRAPNIDQVLAAVEPDTPLMLDLKCFTRRAARRIRRSVPGDRELYVSCRSWWVLGAFADRQRTTLLRSCRTALQLGLAKRLPGLGREVGVVVHQSVLDQATVRGILGRTPHVFTWAVTTPDRARELLDAGVSGLIVDDLDADWPRGGSRPGP